MADRLVSVDATTKSFPPEVVTANTGATSGVWAAGDDSRITGATQKPALGVVQIEDYPRLGGETDDSGRFTRALAAMAADTALRILALSAADYTLTSTVTVDVDRITIRGAGQEATRLIIAADVVALNFTSVFYPMIERLTVYCNTTGRTVFPVVFTDCAHPVVDAVSFRASDGARHSGIKLAGEGGVASMGVISHCVFSHSCILVEVDDVKITDSWVWAMTCDYAIAIRNGSQNCYLANVDVVPPLASTATGIAGIVVGDDVSFPFGCKMLGIYLDGNPGLNVRAGIKVCDGVGNLMMKNVHANKMDAEAIIIDSAYNVLIEGYSSYSNNNQGTGAPEILITKTGAQPVENIRISDAQFLQTEAVAGTAGPAVRVDSSVVGAHVIIDGFDIKQPASGGAGYSVPEIDVPTSGGYPTVSMRGRGKRGVYRAIGSQAVANGATGSTIILATPYPMAYRPRPSQISIAFETAMGRDYRIQYTSDNQIYVAFASALSADGTIHWRADLAQ